MFNKELKIYLEYFKDKIEKSSKPFSEKETKYLLNFQSNLESGIEYYKDLYSKLNDKLKDELEILENELKIIKLSILDGVDQEKVLN